MATLEQARRILVQLGLPKRQTNDISGYTLLVLCGLKQRSPWSSAKCQSLTLRLGIMERVAKDWGKHYAENSREQFRRQVLHQFVQAGIALYNPDDPGLPTNSQKNHYAISKEALAAVRAFGTGKWSAARERFLAETGSLAAKYATPRHHKKVPVVLPSGGKLLLSPGRHNEVQAAVIREFAPRFAPGAAVLYLGDTANKALFVEAAGLMSLGIPITEHDKLPDVVLHDPARKWLFLVEAVTSHGPMSPKRVTELRAMMKRCTAGLIYVSAFPDMAEFKRHAAEIAWDTEVWLSEMPDHLMHFNGDRFLGPR